MNLEELQSILHRKSEAKEAKPNRLKRNYRKHYPLVKDAVLSGIPLRTVIMVLQEEESAFAAPEDRDQFFSGGWQATYQAFRRALKRDNIALT
jgi:hypothetical protein